jgi:hypothetical protein
MQFQSTPRSRIRDRDGNELHHFPKARAAKTNCGLKDLFNFAQVHTSANAQELEPEPQKKNCVKVL